MISDLALETFVPKDELSFGTPFETAGAKLRFVQVPDPLLPASVGLAENTNKVP
jgi:hypothetical protein